MTVWNPTKKEFWEFNNLMGRNKPDTVEKSETINNDGWEHCPRCGSNRVQQLGKFAKFFVFFGSGGCLIWVGVIFFPVLFIAIPLIFLSPLAFLLPKTNQCKDCNYSWVVKKN